MTLHDSSYVREIIILSWLNLPLWLLDSISSYAVYSAQLHQEPISSDEGRVLLPMLNANYM